MCSSDLSFLPLLSFSHPLILLFEWSSFATSRRSPVWFAQALQAHSTTTTRSISLPNCSVERTPPLMSFTSALRTSSALLCKEALGNGNPNPLWTGFYCSLKCDFRCRYRRWPMREEENSLTAEAHFVLVFWVMQLRASLVGFVLIALISIVAAWGSDRSEERRVGKEC